MPAAAPMVTPPVRLSVDQRAVQAMREPEHRERLAAAVSTGKVDALQVAKHGVALSHAIAALR